MMVKEMVELVLNNSCPSRIEPVEDIPARGGNHTVFCLAILKSDYDKKENGPVRKVIRFLIRTSSTLLGPERRMVSKEEDDQESEEQEIMHYWLTPSTLAIEETLEKAAERIINLLTGKSRGITSPENKLEVRKVTNP